MGTDGNKYYYPSDLTDSDCTCCEAMLAEGCVASCPSDCDIPPTSQADLDNYENIQDIEDGINDLKNTIETKDFFSSDDANAVSQGIYDAFDGVTVDTSAYTEDTSDMKWSQDGFSNDDTTFVTTDTSDSWFHDMVEESPVKELESQSTIEFNDPQCCLTLDVWVFGSLSIDFCPYKTYLNYFGNIMLGLLSLSSVLFCFR